MKISSDASIGAVDPKRVNVFLLQIMESRNLQTSEGDQNQPIHHILATKPHIFRMVQVGEGRFYRHSRNAITNALNMLRKWHMS